MTAAAAGLLLDVEHFAAQVLDRPLWPHQLDLARSPARYRVACAGRQVGKSVALAVIALHTAATRRNATVLLVSAGEEAAKRLLAECAALARDRLGGSLVDESKATVTLSNGSVIRSVPASERQIRGWPVDLLIVDEAGFVSNDIWRAAEPAIIARPGSRVIVTSSPWGGADHWFRALWQRGMDRPDEHVAGWHWPSSVSPLVDASLLEQIREREPADYFRREFLAEWTDATGAYFAESEIMAATADYRMTSPDELPVRRSVGRRYPVAAGVDWGVAVDANALALVARLDNPLDGRARLFVPWIVARHQTPFTDFIDEVVDVAGRYWLRVLASERNGIGEFPTTELEQRLRQARAGVRVAAVWTDQRRKMSGFGRLKGLMQTDRLVLPMHPPLLRELRALEFEQAANGGLRLAVPERAGHDDMIMALMQAVSCIELTALRDDAIGMRGRAPNPDTVRSGRGSVIPRQPRPDSDRVAHITVPGGEDGGDGW